MPLENWSDNVVVVRLADNPHTSEDLDALESAIQQRRVDAVIDFSGVRMITSTNLAKLLKLRKAMNAASTRLILCGANDQQVWGAFLVTNLDKLFEFTGDVTMALTMLQLKTDRQ